MFPVALYDLKTDHYEMLNRMRALPAANERLRARTDKLNSLVEAFETQFLPLLQSADEQPSATFSN